MDVQVNDLDGTDKPHNLCSINNTLVPPPVHDLPYSSFAKEGTWADKDKKTLEDLNRHVNCYHMRSI